MHCGIYSPDEDKLLEVTWCKQIITSRFLSRGFKKDWTPRFILGEKTLDFQFDVSTYWVKILTTMLLERISDLVILFVTFLSVYNTQVLSYHSWQ